MTANHTDLIPIPCPYCGAEAEPGPGGGQKIVHTNECWFTGSVVGFPSVCSAVHFFDRNVNPMAIEAWNKRSNK